MLVPLSGSTPCDCKGGAIFIVLARVLNRRAELADEKKAEPAGRAIVCVIIQRWFGREPRVEWRAVVDDFASHFGRADRHGNARRFVAAIAVGAEVGQKLLDD